MPTNIESLPEAEHEKWHRFIDAVNAAVTDIFNEEEDHPVLVIGAQWGEMGSAESDLPNCLVTSNLPVCVTMQAIEEMHEFAVAAHEEYHGMPVDTDPERVVKEPIPFDRVPEEVRQRAIEWAESLGYTADDVQFIEVADAGDLADLPLFEGHTEPQAERGEN